MLPPPVLTDRHCASVPVQGIDGTWQAFGSSRDRALRGALVQHYQQFARMLAAKSYARRSTADLEFDDYLQYAQIGLLEAIDRFDYGRGIKFETFAAMRINGAILNGIASASELQEQLAARRRMVAQRAGSLVEEQQDVPAEDVFSQLAEVAIGLALGFMLEGSGMMQLDEDQAYDNTYSRVELRQLRAHLHRAIGHLPERHRQVIFGHYIQGQPFDEIAVTLGVSKGRVSQLHADGLKRLKAGLGSRGNMDFSC